MIVITGTGRSGTSLLSQLYHKLGYHVAGADVWWDGVNAGYESLEISQLNNAIIEDMARFSSGRHIDIGKKIWQFFSRNFIKSDRDMVSIRNRILRMPGINSKLVLQNFSKMEMIANRYKPDILAFSEEFEVIKNPGFNRTLPVWVLAGAKIDHTNICMRSISSVVQSQKKGGFLRFESEDLAYNHYAYLVGLSMFSVLEYDLPYTIFHFPAWIKDPTKTFENICLPRQIGFEEFEKIFNELVSENLVHH